MIFTGKDVLKSTLGEFFKYNLYAEAIGKLRKAIKEKEYYKSNWENVVRLYWTKSWNQVNLFI